IATYADQGLKSFESGDHPLASLCYQRAVILSPYGADHVLKLAQVAEAMGHHDYAREMVERVAPLDAIGYGPAQLWAAERLLSGGEVDAHRVADAEAHLVHALDSDPSNRRAHGLPGQVYAGTGRPKEAIPHLVWVHEGVPELGLILASCYRAIDWEGRAHSEAEAVRDSLQRRLQANPDDDEARFQQAMSLLFL